MHEIELNLEAWLRKKNMEVKRFAKIIGCSRQTLWKVKRDKKIEPKIAFKIWTITNGQVSPKTQKRGRPKKIVVNKSTIE
jgi:DNA-binding XRE family transcriptional regulator